MIIYNQKLLTNFNSDRWKGINMKSVEECINVIKRSEIIFGELSSGEDCSCVSLPSASHSITNINIKNNCIYGDIYTLTNPNGRISEEMINAGYKFKIRCVGTETNDEIILKRIITWDLSDISLQQERNEKLEKLLN